jgi:hypothetical protein
MYDRQGNRICTLCYAELFASKPYDRYRRVAWTVLDHGLPTQVIISTVWLGIDHNFSFQEPRIPLIFETMIFLAVPENDKFDMFGNERGLGESVYQDRYPTEESALAGHDRAVEWAKDQLFLKEKEAETNGN